MSKLILTPEDQLQRLNHIREEAGSWQALSPAVMTHPPAPGQWSLLEVVGHMNSAYRDYEDRITRVLAALPGKEDGYSRFSARWLPKKLILSFRPRNGERRYKMKTMAKFHPEVAAKEASPGDIQGVFDRFHQCQEHLREAILESRNKDVSRKKVDSAIGPLVRFYLPEAFDFLISHEERHMQQGREVLAVAEVKVG